MSKPKQVFSIRIDPEILRKIRNIARKEKSTVGSLLRENLDGFLKLKEEADESSHHENHSGGRDSSCPGSFCPDESPGPQD